MNYRIVVDAGHGGSDPGAISGNLKEKDYTLKAANYMYNRFKELGVPVIITRDNDTTLTRQERLNKMRSLGTDSNVIILSNHINAGGGEGAEVIYPLRSNSILPTMILQSIGEEGQIMRKVYQRRLPENPSLDYYYIMRETPSTTALLIEYGFIDNKNDQVKLNNNILNYAEAVVRAVMNYIDIPYVEPNSQLEDIYTVKKGDTLYSISRKYNIPIDKIKELNNLDSNILSIGQKLILKEELIPTNEIIYTVKRGDTLYSISKRYGVNIEDIINLNNLQSTILSINQQLLIPTETINNKTTYIVEKGDTLWSIANKYNTTVTELKRINNLNNNILKIGQELIIEN